MAGQAFTHLAFDNGAFDVDLVSQATASQTVPVPSQSATATVLVQAEASQTVPVPTQTATVTVGGFVANQTVPVPTQVATATVEVSAVASQTVPAPTNAATATVLVQAVASQTVPVPTQTARVFQVVYGRDVKAQRYGYSFIARRIQTVEVAQRQPSITTAKRAA